jgi:4-hydroxy-3-methylbut-2-enyl diphosphate reductase
VLKLLLAAPRGFCAGVEMAVAALDRALERFGPPIYVYHQIVHNRTVVADFTRRGVIFVDALDAVPCDATLFYSAHGVSPEVREESRRRNLTVIDATCPLVLKVHNEARRYAEAGARVVLIGHAGHDEVVGVAGEIPGRYELAGSDKDIDELPDDGKPIAYVTQTTLSTTETRTLIERLRARFPDIQSPPKDDICYATTNRQETIRSLATEAQLVIVLGSENSSNTLRLVETARASGARAERIDGPEELDFAWFHGVTACAITAGASAPETLFRATVETIANRLEVEIEERPMAVETLHFALPESLNR